MDRWFIMALILMFTVSFVVIFARRQEIKEKRQSETNPSADDFEILED